MTQPRPIFKNAQSRIKYKNNSIGKQLFKILLRQNQNSKKLEYFVKCRQVIIKTNKQKTKDKKQGQKTPKRSTKRNQKYKELQIKRYESRISEQRFYIIANRVNIYAFLCAKLQNKVKPTLVKQDITNKKSLTL